MTRYCIAGTCDPPPTPVPSHLNAVTSKQPHPQMARSHGSPEAVSGHNCRVRQMQQAVSLRLLPNAAVLHTVQHVPQCVHVQCPLPYTRVCDVR